MIPSAPGIIISLGGSIRGRYSFEPYSYCKMVKSCLFLLCLLFLAGCSHTPKAQQAASSPAPMAKDSSSSEESDLTTFPSLLVPLVEDAAVLDTDTVEPDGAAEPDLSKRLAEEQDISRPEVTTPTVEAAIAVEPNVSEPKLADVATTRPDAIEREVFAPPVEAVALVGADLTEPEVDKLEREAVTDSRPEVTTPTVKATIAVEPDVSDPKVADVSTTRPNAIEREIFAPPVEEAAAAEADLSEPEVDKLKGEDVTVSEPDLFGRDVEGFIAEPDVTNSPVESDVAESVDESTILAEPDAPRPNLTKPELSEAVREEEKDTSHLITTQLTVVSMTGTALNFLSGDELKPSVPLSQAATGAVLYTGAREVELWKSSYGGDTVADSVMEVVGSVALSGDASSYMLLCASAEVTLERGAFRLVLLPNGLGHVSENSMCFVNLTAWDLGVQLDELEFLIPSQSHYDLQFDDARRSKVHIVADAKPVGRDSDRSISEDVRDPLGKVIVFLPSENPLAEPKAIRMQAISSSAMPPSRYTPPDQATAEPKNSNNAPLPEQFRQRHPIMTPETRTY